MQEALEIVSNTAPAYSFKIISVLLNLAFLLTLPAKCIFLPSTLINKLHGILHNSSQEPYSENSKQIRVHQSQGLMPKRLSATPLSFTSRSWVSLFGRGSCYIAQAGPKLSLPKSPCFPRAGNININHHTQPGDSFDITYFI